MKESRKENRITPIKVNVSERNTFADIVKPNPVDSKSSSTKPKPKITPMTVEVRKTLLNSFTGRFEKVYLCWNRESVSAVKDNMKRLAINVTFPLISFIGVN
jgi:hypothetical protein